MAERGGNGTGFRAWLRRLLGESEHTGPSPTEGCPVVADTPDGSIGCEEYGRCLIREQQEDPVTVKLRNPQNCVQDNYSVAE